MDAIRSAISVGLFSLIGSIVQDVDGLEGESSGNARPYQNAPFPIVKLCTTTIVFGSNTMTV